MANDLLSFATRMRKRASKIDDLGNAVAKEGAEAMLRELVSVTPVDTSEAISNWQVGIGQRPPIELPPHFSGRKGSTKGQSSAKAIDEGLDQLVAKRPGQPIYVSNTAKHIVDLDGGTSAQFAGGFIPRALIAFRARVKDAVKTLLE